jgi:hypothetical protein
VAYEEAHAEAPDDRTAVLLGELEAAIAGSMEDYAYAFLDPDDDELPPFFRELCESGYFGDLLYWRVGDRLVAASVGHEDKEEPVVLFAGVTGSAEGFPD